MGVLGLNLFIFPKQMGELILKKHCPVFLPRRIKRRFLETKLASQKKKKKMAEVLDTNHYSAEVETSLVFPFKRLH